MEIALKCSVEGRDRTYKQVGGLLIGREPLIRCFFFFLLLPPPPPFLLHYLSNASAKNKKERTKNPSRGLGGQDYGNLVSLPSYSSIDENPSDLMEPPLLFASQSSRSNWRVSKRRPKEKDGQENGWQKRKTLNLWCTVAAAPIVERGSSKHSPWSWPPNFWWSFVVSSWRRSRGSYYILQDLESWPVNSLGIHPIYNNSCVNKRTSI